MNDSERRTSFIEHLIDNAIRDTEAANKYLAGATGIKYEQLVRVENACVSLANKVRFIRRELSSKFQSTQPVKESSDNE